MRLPKALRGPAELPHARWLAGVGVMVLGLFVAVVPWYEISQRVRDGELPRPRYHTREWGGLSCLGAGGYAVVSVGPDGNADVPARTIDEWLREETASFYVRAHRAAPWSAVKGVFSSAVHAGRHGLGLQVGPSHYIHLVLVTGPPDEEVSPPREEITVEALPLADPAGALAAASARLKARRPAPVLHLAFTGDPDVESVLHALECYADDDTVWLAIER